MTMTKEELVELIKQTIADLKKEEKVAELDKAIENENECHENIVDNLEQEKQDVEAGVVQNSEPSKIQNQCDSVQNECGDDKKTEVKNEEVTEGVKEEVKEEIQEGKEEGKTEEEVKEEVKEEIVEEKKEESDDSEDEKKEEKKEEVIKLEALNSTPKTEGIDIVKNFAPTQTSAKGYAITTIVR